MTRAVPYDGEPESQCDHIWSIPDDSGFRECLWCGSTTQEEDGEADEGA